jgi:hypothetical protein
MVYFIDDPAISKLLKQALLRSKKKELAMYFSNKCDEFVRSGFDYKILMEKFKGQIPR